MYNFVVVIFWGKSVFLLFGFASLTIGTQPIFCAGTTIEFGMFFHILATITPFMGRWIKFWEGFVTSAFLVVSLTVLGFGVAVFTQPCPSVLVAAVPVKHFQGDHPFFLRCMPLTSTPFFRWSVIILCFLWNFIFNDFLCFFFGDQVFVEFTQLFFRLHTIIAA
jgi:hypothetical protein